MHRIDTPTASDEGLFVGSGQVTGDSPTDLDNTWFNDIQENVCNAIENEGVPLVKGDYQQLSNVIQGIAGKKRNLNYNPAFYITQKWGALGSGVISTPISGSESIVSTGWVVGGSINTTGDLTITPSINGLTISGTAASTGQTIAITQNHSRLEDAVFGNDTITTAGETKYFTSSVKYKKVSGVDFTIKSYIGSIASDETIISDVTNDSSVESVGMAYKQTSVNTKDLGFTPVVNCGFEISLASAGAFSIQIKNCDFTEGLTLPDFQTYGDYIADKAFAVAEYGEDSLSGAFYSLIPIISNNTNNKGSWSFCLPIATKNIGSEDTITLSNESLTVYDTISGDETTASNISYDAEIRTSAGGNSYIRIFVSFDFSGTPTTAYTGQLNFDWVYAKA